MKHSTVKTTRFQPAAPGAPPPEARPEKSPVFPALKPPRGEGWPSRRATSLSALFRRAEERVLGQVIAAAHQPDAAAIHDLRVTLRRFAELLQTARIAGLLSDAKGRRLLRRIRAIRRLGGAVRDIDVLKGLLSTPPATSHRAPNAAAVAATDRPGLKQFRKREELVKKLQSELRKLISSGFLTMLNQSLTTGPTAPRSLTAAHIWRRVLVNRRNFSSACRVAAAGGNDIQIHRARIAAKKLRYSYELASEAGVPRLQMTLTQLKRFQKITGDLHDAHLAMEFFESGAKRRRDTLPRRLPARMATRHKRLHAAAIRELACWLNVPVIPTTADPDNGALSKMRR